MATVKRVIEYLYKFCIFLRDLVKREPAIGAAIINVGIALGAYFGLHVSGEQLIYYFGIVTAILGLVVRMGVVPLAKLAGESALKGLADETPDILSHVADDITAKAGEQKS